MEKPFFTIKKIVLLCRKKALITAYIYGQKEQYH